MCLAIPAKVLKVKGKHAECDFGGVKRDVNIEMTDGIKEGDYVVVHVGYAIEKMSEEEAMESFKIWNKLLEMEENKDLLKKE